MKPAAIYNQAVALGLSLKGDGDDLLVFGKRDYALPAELVAELHQHKGELLDLLQAKPSDLTPDCAAWLPVARQILAGEFDGADRSTRESLIIGLRGIPDSSGLCRRALDRVRLSDSKHTGK